MGEDTARRDPMSQSMLMSAASIVITERPKLESRSVGWILWILMIMGLLSFVAGMTLIAAVGVCQVLILLAHNQVVPPYFGDAAGISAQLWIFIYYTMLGSALYGFASFLWYKLAAAKVIGNTLSWVLFFIVPILLILSKVFKTQIEAGTGVVIPVEVMMIATYYSFFWYLVIFLIASYNYRTDVNERAAHTLTRWSLLAILCYIPYGYVLFVGETTVFGPYIKQYLGDASLIIWTLLPIRR